MEGVHINTSQNVIIDYNLATIGNRIVARLLDGVFIVAYLFIICLIILGIFFNGDFTLSSDYSNESEFWVIFLFIITVLPVFFYSLWAPYFMQGQTLGKKIMKIKIVRADGTEATFGTYFVRWLLNIVDSLFYNIVGLVTMTATEKRQRVADLVAGTVVITIKQKVSVDQTVLYDIEEDYFPKFSQVLQLSDKDIGIIKTSLSRALKNGDYELIKKLRNKIESVIFEYKPEMSDEEYVDTVLKDYQYFSQQ